MAVHLNHPAFVLAGLLCITGSASAQTLPLVSETIVDPGRFSDSPTADVLAVGSMGTFGSRSAADAAVNPAGLLRGPRADVTAAIGAGKLWRDVSIGLSTAASPEPQRVEGAWFPAVFVAAAVRRPAWAAGGFYDGSARHRHEFTTGDRLISQISSPGGAVFQQVSGRTHLSEATDVSRLGGSVAVAPFGRWLSIGGSVELTRSRIDTISESELEGLSMIRPQPPVTSRRRETIAFTADDWSSGFTIGAGVHPSGWLTLSVQYRWAPEFAAMVTGDTANLDTGTVQAFDQPLTMNSPDVFTAGAAVTLSSTRFGFELARVEYGVFDEDDLMAIGGGFLQSPAAAWEPRAGVRHEIAIGDRKRLALSAGIRSEGIHALSSSLPNSLVLEPQSRTWITAGGGFESSRLTIAVAVGAAHDERRIMASVSARSGQ